MVEENALTARLLGVEQEPDYTPTARARIAPWGSQGRPKSIFLNNAARRSACADILAVTEAAAVCGPTARRRADCELRV